MDCYSPSDSNDCSGFSNSVLKLKSQKRGRQWSGVEQSPVGFKSGLIMSDEQGDDGNEESVLIISSDDDSEEEPDNSNIEKNKRNVVTQTTLVTDKNVSKNNVLAKNIFNKHVQNNNKVTKVTLSDGTERLLSTCPSIVGTPLEKEQIVLYKETTQTVVIRRPRNRETDIDHKTLSNSLSLQNAASAPNYNPQELNTIWENAINEAQKTYSPSKVPPITISINVNNDTCTASTSLPLSNDSVLASRILSDFRCIKPNPTINNTPEKNDTIDEENSIQNPLSDNSVQQSNMQSSVNCFQSQSEINVIRPIKEISLISNQQIVSLPPAQNSSKQLALIVSNPGQNKFKSIKLKPNEDAVNPQQSLICLPSLVNNHLNNLSSQSASVEPPSNLNILNYHQNGVFPIMASLCNNITVKNSVSSPQQSSFNPVQNSLVSDNAANLSASSLFTFHKQLNSPSLVQETILRNYLTSHKHQKNSLENNSNNIVSFTNNLQNSYHGNNGIYFDVSKFSDSTTLSSEYILTQTIGKCINSPPSGSSTSNNVVVDPRTITHDDHIVSSSTEINALSKDVPPSSENFCFDEKFPVKRKTEDTSNNGLVKKSKLADGFLDRGKTQAHKAKNLEKSYLEPDLLLPEDISSKFECENNPGFNKKHEKTSSADPIKQSRVTNSFIEADSMSDSLFQNPSSSASIVIDSPSKPVAYGITYDGEIISTSLTSKETASNSDNVNKKSSMDSGVIVANALTDVAIRVISENKFCSHCELHNFDDESIMDHSKEYICKNCPFVSSCKVFMTKHILSNHTDALKTKGVLKNKTSMEHVMDHTPSNESSGTRMNSSTCSPTNTKVGINSFTHITGDNLILIEDSSDEESEQRNGLSSQTLNEIIHDNLGVGADVNMLDEKKVSHDYKVVSNSVREVDKISKRSSYGVEAMSGNKFNENILINESSDDDCTFINDVSENESLNNVGVSHEKSNLNNLGDKESIINPVIDLCSHKEPEQIIIKNELESPVFGSLSSNCLSPDQTGIKDEFNESTYGNIESKFTLTDNRESKDFFVSSNHLSSITIKDEPNLFSNSFTVDQINENLEFPTHAEKPVISSFGIEFNADSSRFSQNNRSDNACCIHTGDKSAFLIEERVHNYNLENDSDFMDDLNSEPCLNIVKVEGECILEETKTVDSESGLAKVEKEVVLNDKNQENTDVSEKIVEHEIADDKPFICQHCGFGVATDQNLQLHIKAFHSTKKSKQIPKACPNSGKKVQAVVVSTETVKCSQCSFQCTRPSVLRKHLVIEHEILACDKCAYHADNSDDLTRHYKLVHTKMVCPHCWLRFPIKEYDKHVVDKHSLNFKCSQCLCNFTLKSKLTEHYHSVHKGNKNEKCLTCAINILKCPDCDFITKLQASLNHHRLKKHHSTSQRKVQQTDEPELCSELISIRSEREEDCTMSKFDNLKESHCEEVPDKSNSSIPKKKSIPYVSNRIGKPSVETFNSHEYALTTLEKSNGKEHNSEQKDRFCFNESNKVSDKARHDLTKLKKPNHRQQMVEANSSSLYPKISLRSTPENSVVRIKSDVNDGNHSISSAPKVSTQSKITMFYSNNCDLTTVKSNCKEDSSEQKDRCRFLCSNCGYRASNESSFQEHILDKHSPAKLLKCYYCKYSFEANSELTKHKYECHPDKYPFSCTKCPSKFSKKKYLAKHTVQMHDVSFENKLKNLLKPGLSSEITCKDCEFKSDNESIMDQHKLLNHRNVSENLSEFSHDLSGDFKDFKHDVNSPADSDYKCNHCTFATKKEKELREHKYTSHLEFFPFSCKHCIYRTNRRSHLVKHETVTHGKPRSKYTIYECSYCPYKTSEIKELNQHKYKKHWAKYRFKCGDCSYRGETKTSLKSHCKSVHKKIINTNTLQPRVILKRLPANILRELELRDSHTTMPWKLSYPDLVINVDKEHDNAADYVYCKECNNFKTKLNYEYERHLFRRHIGQCFYCKYCTSVFNSYEQYYSHIYEEHSREKRYKCELCCFSSPFPQLHKHMSQHITKCHYCQFEGTYLCVKEHITKLHPEKYPLLCDKCGYQTKSINNLYYHKRKMHDMFLCTLCDCSCEFKHQIDAHIKLFHPEKLPFSCKECNMRFPTPELLVNHTMKFHNNKCAKCDFKGQSTKELIDHKFNNHFSDYELGCVICSFQGARKVQTVLHEIRYHSGRTYRCKWCKYYSRSFDELSSHVTVLHEGETIRACVKNI